MAPMLTFRPVLFILGVLIAAIGFAMLVPAAVDLGAGLPDWRAFTVSSVLSVLVGGVLILSMRVDTIRLTPRQGFLLTAVSWASLSAIGALPFMLSDLSVSFTDAFFEASSGLTTTGSTVLTGLDSMPAGILLWRGMLQWLGGIGIIVMAIAMLPYLRVGGMQLFRMESSERSEKALPRIAQIAGATAIAYLVLSVACAISYWFAGMTGLEAAVHAMTTLSTGGYSTSDASLAHFTNPAIHWIATVFMICGALPFAVYIRAVRESPAAIWQDSQVRRFLTGLTIAVLTMALWLWIERGEGFGTALRLAAVNVVSVVTTTGFASADYGQWGPFATLAFLFLTLIGGCTGSTSGGIKALRFEIASIMIRSQMKRLFHPHGVFPVKYRGRAVPPDVTDSVINFLCVFFASFVGLTIALSGLGLDPLTAASGAATAIANVGPGLGPIIGPAGNFASLPDAAKWLLSAGMLMGRLEFLTVLVLFTRLFWRG